MATRLRKGSKGGDCSKRRGRRNKPVSDELSLHCRTFSRRSWSCAISDQLLDVTDAHFDSLQRGTKRSATSKTRSKAPLPPSRSLLGIASLSTHRHPHCPPQTEPQRPPQQRASGKRPPVARVAKRQSSRTARQPRRRRRMAQKKRKMQRWRTAAKQDNQRRKDEDRRRRTRASFRPKSCRRRNCSRRRSWRRRSCSDKRPFCSKSMASRRSSRDSCDPGWNPRCCKLPHGPAWTATGTGKFAAPETCDTVIAWSREQDGFSRPTLQRRRIQSSEGDAG